MVIFSAPGFKLDSGEGEDAAGFVGVEGGSDADFQVVGKFGPFVDDGFDFGDVYELRVSLQAEFEEVEEVPPLEEFHVVFDAYKAFVFIEIDGIVGGVPASVTVGFVDGFVVKIGKSGLFELIA